MAPAAPPLDPPLLANVVDAYHEGGCGEEAKDDSSEPLSAIGVVHFLISVFRMLVGSHMNNVERDDGRVYRAHTFIYGSESAILRGK